MDLSIEQKRHDLIKQIFESNNFTVIRKKTDDNEIKNWVIMTGEQKIDITNMQGTEYTVKDSNDIIINSMYLIDKNISEKEKTIYSKSFFAEMILQMNLTTKQIDEVLKYFKTSEYACKVLLQKRFNNSALNHNRPSNKAF